jgi:hypothetical protein
MVLDETPIQLPFPDVKIGDGAPERGLAMFTGEPGEGRSGGRGGGVMTTLLLVRVVQTAVKFTGLDDFSINAG